MSEAPKRGLDSELQSMAKIDRILAEHDEDAVARILAWLNSRNHQKFPTWPRSWIKEHNDAAHVPSAPAPPRKG